MHPKPTRTRRIPQLPPVSTLSMALLVAIGVSGCAPLPPLGTPAQTLTPAQVGLNGQGGQEAPGNPATWPGTGWWQPLRDPQLNQLMDEALAGSPDLRQAAARVRAARALAEAVDANTRPQVSLEGSSTRERFTAFGLIPPPVAGTTGTVNEVMVNGSLDLDFWGGRQAEYRAALGETRAREVEIQGAIWNLTTALFRTYIQFDRWHRQADLIARQNRLRQERIALLGQRVGAGLEASESLRHGEAELAAGEAELEAAREQLHLAGHQLALLAGRGPDRAAQLTPPRLDPTDLAHLPRSLPAELLGRRPDIVAQRSRIEAALADEQAARAAFYPNVNLMGFIGLQTLGFSHFLEAGSRTLGVGPAISLPLFDGGRLAGNLKIRRADYDAAVESYNRMVLAAARETADSLTTLESLGRQDLAQQASRDADRGAWQLSQQRQRQGLASRLEVLVAETQWLARERASIDLKARTLDTQANLIHALGGGFDGHPAPGA